MAKIHNSVIAIATAIVVSFPDPTPKGGKGLVHIERFLVSSPDSTLEEGKGSGELWLNPWFSLYGARRQGHAKLGSDWLLWLHWHVITTSGKANLEPDWSVKLNSSYSDD